MPRQLYARELRDGTAMVLVTVSFAGRSFYLSERPVSITSSSGDVLPFDGGLAGAEVGTVLGLMGSDADLLSVPVACYLPVDLAALRAQGHQFSGTTAEVALWVPGTSYESRQVLVLGKVSEPTYGAQGEQVAFSVTEAPYDDTGRVIHPVEIFRASDFAAYDLTMTVPSESDGAAYPWAFGRVGVCTVAGVLSAVPAVPAVVISLNTATEDVFFALIGSGQWQAPEVIVYDATGASDTLTMIQSLDYGGLTGAYAFGNATQYFTQIGPLYGFTSIDTLATPLYVSAATSGGGGPSYDGSSSPARSWGEIVEMLLRRSSLRLDWGRWRAVLPSLQRYEIAGYVDDPDVSPWDFINSELLPLVPVSIRSGPDGLYPVLWRYDATSADALGHINAGPGTGVMRSGPVEEFPAPSSVVNSFSLSYAYDARTQEYTHWLTHGPSATLIPPAPASEFVTEETLPGYVTTTTEIFAAWTTDLVSSAYSVASVLTFGTLSETLESRFVYNDGTAHLIASWKVLSQCFPRRKIAYDADASWCWLDVGDVVTLTDSELSIATKPALVLESSVTLGGRVALVLLVLDDSIGSPNASA